MTDKSNGDNASNVQQHYNARPQVSTQERTKSPIIHLKLINNYVKSVLIRRFCPPNARVLDICCGKGGDLQKYRKSNIKELVGVDLADISIEQAKGRFNEGRFPFKAHYFAFDCFKVKLKDVLPKELVEKKFQLVSNQFALHYAFETEEKIRNLLKNVSDLLETGCYYIGSIPDAYRIVKRLREIDGLAFGNDVYQIRFEQKETYPTFGHKYYFYLKDGIDDCPEYLVHFPTLVKLAKEYGLELTKKQRFHEFIRDNYFPDMLTRMKVFEDDKPIPEDQWEAIGVYMVFCFKKVGQ